MSRIQHRLDDDALQALREAGSEGVRLCESMIREEIDDFERWLAGHAPVPLNDPLDRFERAILQTYLQYKLRGEVSAKNAEPLAAVG